MPLSADPIDDLSGFEQMTALVFGLGPVFRIAGLPAVARALKVPLDLDLALLASVVANQLLVVAAGELELDVRYRLPRGWWVGVGLKAGWWHVMTEAYEGNESLGVVLGMAFDAGWRW